MNVFSARPRVQLGGFVGMVGLAAVTLAGCGASSSSAGSGATPAASGSATTAPASSAHNTADVAFAAGMIPHHRQAIAMARVAAARAASADVRRLATEIQSAQAPEIATMSGWLSAWGQPVPTGTGMANMTGAAGGMAMTGGASAPASGGGMGDASGMMSEADMAALGKASGAAFDRMFLRMMIAHHNGAVRMAQREEQAGAFPAAKRLADSIAMTQGAQIRQMNMLLGQMR